MYLTGGGGLYAFVMAMWLARGVAQLRLRGSDDIKHVCKSKLGISDGQTSADGMFTMMEVECLVACVNAPMVQVNDDYYEDLNTQNFTQLCDK